MDCIFCKIISKEIPAKILHETNNSICFLDAFPLTKGHVLVIPTLDNHRLSTACGSGLGADNDSVLGQELAVEDLEALRASGVI